VELKYKSHKNQLVKLFKEVTMNKLFIVVVGLVFGASNLIAHAQQRPPTAPGPSLELALEAVQEALSVCATQGHKVTVTVVDSLGNVKAQVRADGANPFTLSISERKVNVVLKYGEASIVIAEKVKNDAELAAEIKADKTLLPWGGAQPLLSNDALIGAIGVSGAPNGDKDDVCTVAAVEKIKGRL
jgi:uncharacterized protein GlcG (DUF336 family)